LIHSLYISIGEDTTATATTRGTLADDITDISVIINGYLQIKRMKAGMNKTLAIMRNHKALGTGIYQVDFTDPRIPASRPLPSFLDEISTLTLRIVDNAPAGSAYHHIVVTALEEDCPTERIDEAKGYPLLVEEYPKKSAWGTDTGYQTYEHERNNYVFGWIYELADNGTVEDPAVNGFDYFKIESRSKTGMRMLVEETSLLDWKLICADIYQVALPTGYLAYEFPVPLNTRQFSNLYTKININTACTAGEFRCLERYLLG